MKWLLRIGALVLVALGAAWLYRDELVLAAVGAAVRARTPVGPHVEVEWTRGPESPLSAPGERPPNVVLILADDLGWNDLTFAGGGVARGSVPTPNIDSIAAEGVTFTNGYAANGTCAPSRAAILSGRYGTRFGFEFTPTPPAMIPLMVRLSARADRPLPVIDYLDARGDEAVAYEAMGMPASEISLAELLASAGYHTAHIGKWHLGRVGGMAPHEQGFAESLLMASGLYLPEDDPEVVNSKQDFDPIDRFLWAGMQYAASFNGGPAFRPRGYLTDYYTDQAVKVIEANRHRPFFLYLAHWAPHTPLQASAADYAALDHIEDHRLRVYAAMIRALDRGVGRVLDALRDNGLEENTLVLFTSDNGGAHYIGLPEVNRPFRGWKISFFEGGIHVPYFARWPARIPAGSTVADPVHHFDLFATAAAAAGAPLPDDRVIDGVDLVPHARGEARGAPHERLFWRQGHYRVVLADGWKLQVAERPDKAWLFHLESDPTEQIDRAARHPERVAAMRAMLAAHDAEQVPSAWPSLIEAPIAVDKDLSQPFEPGDEYVYWPN
ncbi:MAG: sulfatase-like hydrolase/transferase [Myxococcota bacterium]